MLLHNMQLGRMDCDGYALVVFICRRSFGNINEAKQISLEDALKSKEIHAAFISTENRSHEETIRYFGVVFFLFSNPFSCNLEA